MCCYRKLDETFSYGAARYQRYSPELTQPNRIEVCSERRSNGNDAALMHDEWRLTESITWFDRRNDFWSMSYCSDISTLTWPPCRAPRAYDHPRTTYMGGPFISNMAVFKLAHLFCGGVVMMRQPPSLRWWWNRDLPTNAPYQTCLIRQDRIVDYVLFWLYKSTIVICKHVPLALAGQSEMRDYLCCLVAIGGWPLWKRNIVLYSHRSDARDFLRTVWQTNRRSVPVSGQSFTSLQHLSSRHLSSSTSSTECVDRPSAPPPAHPLQ